MSEFAYSGIGLNPHYGTPCNPCDPGTARSPCGSSSGSGVAVAAGPACHGNDSGGRVPASFNRVVGYIVDRALFDGRRSSASRTLDTLGPLANTVEDCVLVDAALRGILLPECVMPTSSVSGFLCRKLLFSMVARLQSSAISRRRSNDWRARRATPPAATGGGY